MYKIMWAHEWEPTKVDIANICSEMWIDYDSKECVQPSWAESWIDMSETGEEIITQNVIPKNYDPTRNDNNPDMTDTWIWG